MKPSPKRSIELRNFTLRTVAAMTIFGTLSVVFHKGHPEMFYAAAALVFAGYWVAPKVLERLSAVLTTLFLKIGRIVSAIVLAMLFYLCYTPIGFLAKLFGSDFLSSKIEKTKRSYWNPVEEKSPDRLQYEREF